MVGDSHPVHAIDDVLLDQSFDEIILSTFRPACPGGCASTSPGASSSASRCR